ncbi:hypothetical protein HK105_208182 [Polyrhizophydium stewartii]|uniref:Peptidase M24 domain-containing protein n=1 Tax=Polyrhizophydium stewartii TaxID=2732419 RepID=A0ABR4MYI1_9FUNG
MGPHDEHSDTEENDNELTPQTVTKYQAAGEVANKALAAVIEAAVDGARVLDLCTLGDAKIIELTKASFTKDKKMQKGIAFPTCVSPASVVCHLSPLVSDPEADIKIKTGDLVRVELGAHFDGFIAQVAHTFVVGASKDAPVTGRKADVIQAAYAAAEAAIRLIKPGNTNWEVTDTIGKITHEFECTPVEGMTTHQILRNVLDGPKQVILNPSEQHRKEFPDATFAEGEAYSIDILVSTGEGKSRSLDTRTTVYKRNADQTYQLKMKTSRAVFSQIVKDHGTMAFTLRALEDEKKGRMGILECTTHGLVTPYPVLHEKDGVDLAHFMFTVLLMPNGPLKISSFPFDQDVIKSDHAVKKQELVDLLAQPVRAAKKKAAKK